jgi:nucleotide-binding universal stress UspA family protein
MNAGPLLISYDGSAEAGHAIEAAAELFGPRRAVVLDVGPPLTPAESVAALSSVVPGNAFDDLNAAGARERADEGAAIARSHGFDAEPRGDVGAPTWQVIVDAADELDAAVIVIGSRGLTGVREQFEGSVSHEVAARAGRPVLVVPPPHREG